MTMLTDTAKTHCSPSFPTKKVSVREAFGVDSDMMVPIFSQKDSHVPDLDDAYQFDPQTTLATSAGLAYDRRARDDPGLSRQVGKSTHIEQVGGAPELAVDPREPRQPRLPDRPCVGKDAIVLKEGKQVTEFREGMPPWCLQRP